MVIPQPDRARELYDRLAPHYGPLAGWWEWEARGAGLDELAAKPGEQILEIGCGPGVALVAIARAVGDSGRVVGLDISPRMCAAARRRVERAGLAASVEVFEADATHMSFANSEFDACFMSFTLELFETERRSEVLAGCRRVLRPNGRLVVVGLSEEGEDTAMRRVYRGAHRRFPEVLDCRPIRIAGTLRAAGFGDVVATVFHMWGLPVELARGTST